MPTKVIKPYDPTTSKTPTPKPAAVGFSEGPIFMPRQLRHLSFGDVTPKEAEAKYDTWRIRMTRAASLGYGRFAQPGDVITISGDTAGLLVLQGQAEWCDSKVDAELAKIAKAKELGLTPAAREKIFHLLRRNLRNRAGLPLSRE